MSLVTLDGGRVGWDAGEGVVASTRFRREGDDLVIESLEFADLASLKSFVRAIAGAATSSRLRGDDAVLTECGFVEDESGWAFDVIVAPVSPEVTRAITLGELEEAIRASWCAETSDDPALWTTGNPAYQQCDVTARVVQDYLGGEILISGVALDGRRVDRHVWNRLPSGLTVDLTREQFRQGERLEAPEVLGPFATENHQERYELLAERVRAKLARSRPRALGAGRRPRSRSRLARDSRRR